MIFHLALRSDWEAALPAGEYRISTLGLDLARVGFIHASFAHQVRGMADRFYAGVGRPLVLLHIDPDRLRVPWRVDPLPDVDPPQGFPHVYGPIAVSAVRAVVPVRRHPDGDWEGLPQGA